MLTMRAIDENGKWLPKSRKVYDLDENGERIKLPSGRWKSHKEDTVDWNEQYHAEEWRHGWEVVQNKYLELAGSPERIDMRSYERQGLDIIPTVHMGTAVSALERKGIATNIGNLNRDIKAANRMMNAIRSTIKNLRDWIADILEATKEVLAENEAAKKNASPNLAVLLRDYLNLRKAERSEWSRYGQQKGTTDDLKTISQATVYLQRHELFTLEDLDIALQGVSEKATAIREDAEALNHPFDEPKQWEIREINEIMNNSIEGWKPFSNPRSFAKYGRQRGWERIPPPDNEPSATGSNLTDGFRELTEEEARQMELPF